MAAVFGFHFHVAERDRKVNGKRSSGWRHVAGRNVGTMHDLRLCEAAENKDKDKREHTAEDRH